MFVSEPKKSNAAVMYIAVRDTTASKNPLGRHSHTRTVAAGTHVIFDEEPAPCWNAAWLDDGQEWFVNASDFRPFAPPRFRIRNKW